ncbi:SpoIIE family protein phosphatase [Streptomyces sp. EAS-AB2608]|uniref:SpoIIE family protein phosphatase n=1 Tax=Streptomyces sp. EAS-AB2608 TaxID=2779671 RepID=UPI0037DA06A7
MSPSGRPSASVRGIPYRQAALARAKDDTLLLYTDGLIERCREETIIVPQRLTACARTTVGLDIADLCERFLRRRTGARSENRPRRLLRVSLPGLARCGIADLLGACGFAEATTALRARRRACFPLCV